MKITERKGFTLIELLVVISIIGILMGIGAVSYSAIQKKARDSRRWADLKDIQNAQEQYYAANNAYVDLGRQGATCAGSIAGIMDTLPTDPISDSTYRYRCRRSDTLVTAYCVQVKLESGTGGNCGGCSCNPGDLTCSFNSGTTDFCIKNLQ